jgi:hypothetical protein
LYLGIISKKGDIIALAGVYTFPFAVMGLFESKSTIEIQKKKITKTRKSSWYFSCNCSCINHCRLYWKYTIEYRFILYLLQYLVPAFGFVAIMLNRSLLIKLLIDALEYFTNLLRKWSSLLTAICTK